jgi:hypothetical protein
MWSTLRLSLVLGLAWLASRELVAQGPQFMKRGEIRHESTSTTVLADEPRPLDQALTAVRNAYGWAVHYEDPAYRTDYDLVHLAGHPSGPRIPAGGAFQSTYPNPSISVASDQEEINILGIIVSDYDRSNNPGQFAVHKLPDGSYDVVGISIRREDGTRQSVTPILDTNISVPLATRDAETAIEAICQVLTAKTGVRVIPGNVLSTLPRAQVTIGGDNISARNLLSQTLNATPQKMQWDLLYDANLSFFAINLSRVTGPNKTGSEPKNSIPSQ